MTSPASGITARPDAPPNRGQRVRHACAILGIWLTLSAFAWPHADSSRVNTSIVGVLITLSALRGGRSPIVWRLTTGFAIWLAASTLLLYPAGSLTLLNNLLVAAGVFVLSVVPERRAPRA